jgi:hypothetical protein
MRWFRWFLAGTFAVPLFHQIALLLLRSAGMTQRAPFAMDPTKPFGVPAVVSLSFWGGVWGIILGLVLARIQSRGAWWTTAIVFGAIAPTLVAGTLVASLKGQPIKFDAKLFTLGLIINGAWALGTVLLYLLLANTQSRHMKSSGASSTP